LGAAAALWFPFLIRVDAYGWFVRHYSYYSSDQEEIAADQAVFIYERTPAGVFLSFCPGYGPTLTG